MDLPLDSGATPAFTRRPRVGVLGDALLDRYVSATPTRLSREAPVPVFTERASRDVPGGAANVALNALGLGAEPLLIGAVGADTEGRRLLELLRRSGLEEVGLLELEPWSTPLKTRVLAAESHRTPTQVLRLDREPQGPLDPAWLEAFARALEARLWPLEALIVSDYGYGTVAALQDHVRRPQVLVCDPRWPLEPLHGATALTPNLEDLARFSGVPAEDLGTDAAVLAAAQRLRERFHAEHVLATLGNRGMLLASERGPALRVAAAGSERVVDVSGAGDTAVAAFTLALLGGLSRADALAYSNAAAGAVVTAEGTATPSVGDLARILAVAREPWVVGGEHGAPGDADCADPAEPAVELRPLERRPMPGEIEGEAAATGDVRRASGEDRP